MIGEQGQVERVGRERLDHERGEQYPRADPASVPGLVHDRYLFILNMRPESSGLPAETGQMRENSR